ncbi:unnamed protein product, partial [Iphiclides podalirius]
MLTIIWRCVNFYLHIVIHCTTGRKPAVALLGRRLRGRLDLLRPDVGERVHSAQQAAEARAKDTPLRVQKPGDPILVRDYSKLGNKWAEAVVLERPGPVSYIVKTVDGRIQKRHVDQILGDSRRSKARFSLAQIHKEPDSGKESCNLSDTASDCVRNINTPLINNKEVSQRDRCEEEVKESQEDTEPEVPIIRARRKAAMHR